MDRWADRHTETLFYAFTFVFAIFIFLYESFHLFIIYTSTYPAGFRYRGCGVTSQILHPPLPPSPSKKTKQKDKSLIELKMARKCLIRAM